MFQYWIQRHDYSASTFDKASPSQAKAAFRDFDWMSELELMDKNDPEKDCRPGMGVGNGIPLTDDGACLLHICPYDAQSVFLYFYLTKATRLLGLFHRTRRRENHVESYDMSKVEELIDLLYARSFDTLLALQ